MTNSGTTIFAAKCATASTLCSAIMLRDKVGVARVADNKLRPVGHRPGKAGRKVIENDDRLARIDEAQRHVTANISSAAGHQNAHPHLLSPSRSPRASEMPLGSPALDLLSDSTFTALAITRSPSGPSPDEKADP